MLHARAQWHQQRATHTHVCALKMTLANARTAAVDSRCLRLQLQPHSQPQSHPQPQPSQPQSQP
eukprot:4704189-Pleurochrysis_carterae.AAC.1